MADQKQAYISMRDADADEPLGCGKKGIFLKRIKLALADFIDELEDGETLTIQFRRHDMTEEEYDALPEM